MSVTFGSMNVEYSSGPAMTGPGNMTADGSQLYFDYTERAFPSKIDWRIATTLTFTPSMGKKQVFSQSDAKYYFTGGWVGPRLVFSE
jgi:hypothetical protein